MDIHKGKCRENGEHSKKDGTHNAEHQAKRPHIKRMDTLKAAVRDVVKHITFLKWKFCGHIMRQEDERWNKRAWRPWTAKRGRGKP